MMMMSRKIVAMRRARVMGRIMFVRRGIFTRKRTVIKKRFMLIQASLFKGIH